MARFFYKEVVANHNQYRGSVYTHSIWRHDGTSNQGLSIEEIWGTKRWENLVFAYIITMTEVSAYVAMAQLYGNQENFVTLRRKGIYS